jgi:hypothetical protein
MGRTATSDDYFGRRPTGLMSWLLGRRRRLVIKPPAGACRPDTFTIGGCVFTVRLTPARWAMLRKAGLPVWAWTRSAEALGDGFFGEAFSCIIVLLVADQVPEDWPPSKLAEGIMANPTPVCSALGAAVNRWQWQRFLAERFPDARCGRV